MNDPTSHIGGAPPQGGTKVAFILVTKGVEYPAGAEDKRSPGARYTRDAIRGMLQFMACKPRHAYKAAQLLFQKLERFAAEGTKFSSGSRQLWGVMPHVDGQVFVSMPRSEFYELVCSTLTEYNYKYAPSSDELKVACSLKERRRHIVVVLCGTSGSGKSTLASILAGRLGISTVISTDTVRHMMRGFTTKQDSPLLFASTYEAGEALALEQQRQAVAMAQAQGAEAGAPPAVDSAAADASLSGSSAASAAAAAPPGPTHEQVVQGYKAQCELVVAQLEVLLAGFEARRQSLVVEGVHLNVGLVLRIMQRFSGVVPFLVYIKSEGKHIERMAVRAKTMTLDPTKNKYVKNMKNIRWIQDYLQRKAEKHLIPCVENTNIDRSVGLIHLTLLGCLKRILKGEAVLDFGSGNTRMLHAEYTVVLDTLAAQTAAGTGRNPNASASSATAADSISAGCTAAGMVGSGVAALGSGATANGQRGQLPISQLQQMLQLTLEDAALQEAAAAVAAAAAAGSGYGPGSPVFAAPRPSSQSLSLPPVAVQEADVAGAATDANPTATVRSVLSGHGSPLVPRSPRHSNVTAPDSSTAVLPRSPLRQPVQQQQDVVAAPSAAGCAVATSHHAAAAAASVAAPEVLVLVPAPEVESVESSMAAAAAGAALGLPPSLSGLAGACIALGSPASTTAMPIPVGHRAHRGTAAEPCRSCGSSYSTSAPDADVQCTEPFAASETAAAAAAAMAGAAGLHAQTAARGMRAAARVRLQRVASSSSSGQQRLQNGRSASSGVPLPLNTQHCNGPVPAASDELPAAAAECAGLPSPDFMDACGVCGGLMAAPATSALAQQQPAAPAPIAESPRSRRQADAALPAPPASLVAKGSASGGALLSALLAKARQPSMTHSSHGAAGGCADDVASASSTPRQLTAPTDPWVAVSGNGSASHSRQPSGSSLSLPTGAIGPSPALARSPSPAPLSPVVTTAAGATLPPPPQHHPGSPNPAGLCACQPAVGVPEAAGVHGGVCMADPHHLLSDQPLVAGTLPAWLSQYTGSPIRASPLSTLAEGGTGSSASALAQLQQLQVQVHPPGGGPGSSVETVEAATAAAAAATALEAFGSDCPEQVLAAAMASAILDRQMDGVATPPPPLSAAAAAASAVAAAAPASSAAVTCLPAASRGLGAFADIQLAAAPVTADGGALLLPTPQEVGLQPRFNGLPPAAGPEAPLAAATVAGAGTGAAGGGANGFLRSSKLPVYDSSDEDEALDQLPDELPGWHSNYADSDDGVSTLQEYGSVYESATHDDNDDHGDDEEEGAGGTVPLGRSSTMMRHLAGALARSRMRAGNHRAGAGGGGVPAPGSAARAPPPARKAPPGVQLQRLMRPQGDAVKGSGSAAAHGGGAGEGSAAGEIGGVARQEQRKRDDIAGSSMAPVQPSPPRSPRSPPQGLTLPTPFAAVSAESSVAPAAADGSSAAP